MQHEITRRIPLLNEKGRLTQEGYAKRLLPAYRRGDIKAGRYLIRERDGYFVCNGTAAIFLSAADNAYVLNAYAALFCGGEEQGISRVYRAIAKPGRERFPETSAVGDCRFSGGGAGIHLLNDGKRRLLIAQIRDFGPDGPLYARLELTDPPEESLVLASSFTEPAEFCYCQRMNCIRAAGEVSYGGNTYVFDNSNSFAFLDWSRGVYICREPRSFGAASGVVDGKLFGFSAGKGLGSGGSAAESALFYDGEIIKLGAVEFDHDPKSRHWSIRDFEGRLDMSFTPRSGCHAHSGIFGGGGGRLVFGEYNGVAVLQDGKKLPVSDFPGFAQTIKGR